MSTLNMPQHVLTCSRCAAQFNAAAVADLHRPPWIAFGCSCGGSFTEPAATLTFADFAEYYAEAGLVEGFCGYGTLPDPLAVWDRLEAVADTLPSNRAAIDAAIDYCREEM